jgi:hypothetical protein
LSKDTLVSESGVVFTRGDIIGYHLEVTMTDILLRNIPDAEVAAIDARAAVLKLSRNEYIRRQLAQAVRVTATPAETPTVGSLQRFAETFADLGDEEITRAAWQ